MKFCLFVLLVGMCSVVSGQEPEVIRTNTELVQTGRYDLKVIVADGVAGTSASQLADFIVK
jgi:hypothetical protein